MEKWQNGIDINILKKYSTIFNNYDKEYHLSLFSKVNESTVADWIKSENIYEINGSVVAAKKLKAALPIKDFRGIKIASAPASTLLIERVAGDPNSIIEIIKNFNCDKILWKFWTENPTSKYIANNLNLKIIGTQILASSEIKSIATLNIETINPIEPIEKLSIIKTNLSTDIDLSDWNSIIENLWINHYSSYNKGKSWKAVSLRSFGGEKDFIEKPSEMSKKWKKDNPNKLNLEVKNTELFYEIPNLKNVLNLLDCEFERIRFMKLDSNGFLTRHADITDKNAGASIGKIARFHLPIQTNENSKFQMWNLDGKCSEYHMSINDWWYLDVRKPHAAFNNGNAARIHLVADAIVNEKIIDILRKSNGN
jgi:hypothetical protein